MNDNYNFKEALDNVLNKAGTNNTILNKPQYKCGVCGRIYDSISERAKCELECLKLKEEEDKKAAEEKKKNEGEYTDLYRLRRVYSSCQDTIKFDKYVNHYLNSSNNLID